MPLVSNTEFRGHTIPEGAISVGYTIEKIERDEDSRRVQVYEFDAAILVQLLKPGPHCYIIVEPAMPEDARVIGSKYDVILDRWRLAIQSQTFPVVPEYEHWPDRLVIVAKILDHGPSLAPRCTGSEAKRFEDRDICDDTECPRHSRDW